MSDVNVQRITMLTISEYVLAVFNLERGLLYTMKELTLRPGQAIKDFLFTEKRFQHIKPLSFLIVTVAISAFVTLKLLDSDINITGMDIAATPNDSAFIQGLLQDFNLILIKYFNLIMMLKIPFLSIFTYLLFAKSKFNFAEHLVINIYTYGYIGVYGIVVGLSFILFSSKFVGIVMTGVVTMLTVIYPIYVYIKLFEEPLIHTIIKSLCVYLIGNVLHTVFIGLIAFSMQFIN